MGFGVKPCLFFKSPYRQPNRIKSFNIKLNAFIGFPNSVPTESGILPVNGCPDSLPGLIKLITQHFPLILCMWTKRYANPSVRCSTLNRTMHFKNPGLIHERCSSLAPLRIYIWKLTVFFCRLKEDANGEAGKLGTSLPLAPICHALVKGAATHFSTLQTVSTKCILRTRRTHIPDWLHHWPLFFPLNCNLWLCE